MFIFKKDPIMKTNKTKNRLHFKDGTRAAFAEFPRQERVQDLGAPSGWQPKLPEQFASGNVACGKYANAREGESRREKGRSQSQLGSLAGHGVGAQGRFARLSPWPDAWHAAIRKIKYAG